MLKVTNKAVTLLKATAKAKGGVSDDAGIRIMRDAVSGEHGTIRLCFDICDEPETGDAELQQDGLRIFVEDGLTEPLEGLTLDVRNEEVRPEFVFV
jgi:Fe-S cluster assembly iron-binding protein IscA